MNQINSVSPNFYGTKKTMLGNEYQTSNKNKKLGGLAGFVAGGGVAYWRLRNFKGGKKTFTYEPEKYNDNPKLKNFIENKLNLKAGDKYKYRDLSNRRNFIKQLNEMDLSLSKFGKVQERTAIKYGIRGVMGAIALTGVFVGAMIGKHYDSRNNQINANIADATAQSSK